MNSAQANHMRDYSAFKGWKWSRLDAKRVQIWTTTICSQCWKEVCHASYVISEPDDAPLNLSGVHAATRAEELAPLRMAYIPFAGAPAFCHEHYKMWIEGKVLPNENQGEDV